MDHRTAPSRDMQIPHQAAQHLGQTSFTAKSNIVPEVSEDSLFIL